jgi:two-component system LytT family response regulator
VREYLQNYPDIEMVQECGDGFEGIKAIQLYQPDLIFLDIQMPKINGFEMLELIDQPPAVVFTTAFEEYAIKAFESHAVDYLLKPFSKDRFEKAIQKWRQQNRQEREDTTHALINNPALNASQQNRVVVKDNGKIRIIPITNIQYLEAADDYVKIHTTEGIFLKNKTMGYFEEALEAQNFIRIHRSYIINVQLITRIDPYEKENHLAILSMGTKLPVSKAGYAKLKQVLGI